jgi:hypothetical protein
MGASENSAQISDLEFLQKSSKHLLWAAKDKVGMGHTTLKLRNQEIFRKKVLHW